MLGRVLTLLILTFTFASMGKASSASEKALALVKMNAYQDGPNCFNTSLLSLGYTHTQIYASATEVEYYLKYHCQEVSLNLNKLEPSSLLTYSEDGLLIHTAVAINTNEILEKNSLYGSKHKEVFGDPAPGKYLLHSVKKSIFFSQLGKKENARAKAYRCEPSAQVLARQTEFESDDSIRRLKEFLTSLGELQKIQNKTELTKKMNAQLLQKFKSLRISEALESSSPSAQKELYRLSLAESLAYQWNLLNCSDAYAKYDECYAPEMQLSIDTLEAFYPQIFRLREKLQP
ncbi:hypothetical protein [Bdellovibrio bacteriovorus]|uniref:hypothetical protein n=1 Tax=Bdellovibrio bacteriovorus TaxID=959 RepID=UPI0035A72B5E